MAAFGPSKLSIGSSAKNALNYTGTVKGVGVQGHALGVGTTNLKNAFKVGDKDLEKYFDGRQGNHIKHSSANEY